MSANLPFKIWIPDLWWPVSSVEEQTHERLGMPTRILNFILIWPSDGMKTHHRRAVVMFLVVWFLLKTNEFWQDSSLEDTVQNEDLGFRTGNSGVTASFM